MPPTFSGFSPSYKRNALESLTFIDISFPLPDDFGTVAPANGCSEETWDLELRSG